MTMSVCALAREYARNWQNWSNSTLRALFSMNAIDISARIVLYFTIIKEIHSIQIGAIAMPEILIAMQAEPRHISQIREAAAACEVVFADAPSDAELARARVIVGNVPVDRLAAARQLELVQLQSAGVGAYSTLCAPGRGVRVCTASGAYGLAISEHMFGLLLGLQKRLFSYRDRAGEWCDLGPVRSVSGSNVLVVGLGDIGGAFARRCKAFGAHVVGIRRSPGPCPEACDAVGVTADIDRWLPEADIVFLCVPETGATRHLFDRERIFSMKPGAILLNAGRGTAVDTDALVDALNAGHLFGAGLDVTDPEPLPADHPLWACPNACITPHVSGGLHLAQTHDAIVRIACANIRAYLAGAPLTNEVNYERGY